MYMDFKVVSIDRPSARVLGKMRKGKKVRVSKGCGMQLVVHASRINPMTRCFDKGKAHTIELTPQEIAQNRSADMSGSGLFDDIRGGFEKFGRDVKGVAEKVGREIKPVAEKVGRAIEPVAKQVAGQALDVLAEQAPNIGASALSGLALFAGQPELVPLAQMAGRQAGQALGNLARDEGKKALGQSPSRAVAQAEYDDMIRELPMPPRRNAPPSRGVATNVLSEKSLADYTEDELGREIARRRGGYSTPLDSSGGKKVLSPYVSAVGQGLGAGMREKSTVGVRGNLIGCGTPPALQSQAYSANFQMASRLPPQYAQLIHS